jgi:hypothetical protein
MCTWPQQKQQLCTVGHMGIHAAARFLRYINGTGRTLAVAAVLSPLQRAGPRQLACLVCEIFLGWATVVLSFVFVN